MTEETGAVGADNTQEVVETTTDKHESEVQEVTTETEWTEAPPKKQNYVKKLQTEKRELHEEVEELKAQMAANEVRREQDVAIAKYWEEVVTDETVQAYKKKYPDMTYEEAIRLSGKTPDVVWSGNPYGMHWIPSTPKWEKKELTIDELERGLSEAIANGEVSV